MVLGGKVWEKSFMQVISGNIYISKVKQMILFLVLFLLIFPQIAVTKEDYYAPIDLIITQGVLAFFMPEPSFNVAWSDDVFGTHIEGKVTATKQYGIYSGLFISGIGKEKKTTWWRGEKRKSTRPKRILIKPTISTGVEIKNLRISAGCGYEVEDEIDFKKFTPYISIGYCIFGKEKYTENQSDNISVFDTWVLVSSPLSGMYAGTHSLGMFSVDGRITRHVQVGLVWALPPVFDDGSFFVAPSISYELSGKPLHHKSAISFGSYIGWVGGGDTELLEDVQLAKSPLYGGYIVLKQGNYIPMRIDLLMDSKGKKQILISFGFGGRVE